MDYLSSNSFLLMEKSLGFLWTKQAAILDNIANAETPNYKAKVVTFEETIQSKLEAARAGIKPRQTVRKVLDESEFAVTEHLDATRMDENGAYSNGSGCGNDTASERSMVRKYIVDSVKYWKADTMMFRKDIS